MSKMRALSPTTSWSTSISDNFRRTASSEPDAKTSRCSPVLSFFSFGSPRDLEEKHAEGGREADTCVAAVVPQIHMTGPLTRCSSTWSRLMGFLRSVQRPPFAPIDTNGPIFLVGKMVVVGNTGRCVDLTRTLSETCYTRVGLMYSSLPA